MWRALAWVFCLLGACGGHTAPAETSGTVQRQQQEDASTEGRRADGRPSPTHEGLPSRALFPRGHEALPPIVEGVLVTGGLDGFELAGAHPANRRGYFLAVNDFVPRHVLVDGEFLDPEGAEALGVGPVAIVRAEVDLSAGCSRGMVCLSAVTPIRVEVDAMLSDAFTLFGPRSDRLADLRARATRHAEGALEGRPVDRAEERIAFHPAWLPDQRQLVVTIVAVQERVSVTTEPNPDPAAGSFGCEAPAGADCAPRHIPETSNVWRTAVGEAAQQVVFDEEGSRIAVRDAGDGARPLQVTSGGPGL